MSSRIKVLFISYNGIIEYLSHSQIIPYLRELSKRGIKFILLSYEKKNDLKKKEVIYDLRRTLANMDIEWRRLVYHKKPTLLAKLFDISLGVVYSLYLALTRRVNLLHARSTVPVTIAIIVAKLLRIKFIFDMRGLIAEEYVDGGLWKKNSLKYKLVNYLERKFFSYANAIVVLTNKIRSIFVENNYFPQSKNANINVIPCCVDLERFKYMPSKDEELLKELNLNGKFIFAYVGSLGTWYMLEEMLDFFTIAKRKIPNAHLLILTQSDRKFIDRIVAERQINKEDLIITSLQPSIVSRFISLNDAGLFFIKPTFSKQASSPTKLGEFLACGVPVVINSKIGDTEELVRSNRVGVVVKDFVNSSYESTTIELLELLKEKQSLRNRCRQTAEKFLSLEQGVEMYKRLYQSLC